ncbi:MAG TPA: hypothetical protein VKV19_06115 [Ktedonobacteraceae bacterium]|nr:hypothetical protein [Ktedonobacteraceae bacterium]
MVKQRTPEQIRRDAVKMGIKKVQSSCPACAEKYFELAKQHGATEQEIQDALEQAIGMRGKGLSRRDLIKYAVASAGGLAVTTNLLLSLEKPQLAHAQSSSFFGIDSNTTICCAMPFHFYVGRMGYGIYPDTFYFAFNTAMAQQVGNTNTFGYWGVQGPEANAGYSTAYAWGVAQAQAAWAAWNSTFVGASYVGGYTVFGDVEAGFGGWGSDITQNQEVISGFLSELFAITPSEVWPGLYVSPPFWNDYLGGNSFVPGTSFVLWINGVYVCNVCGPCNESCTTTPGDAEYYFTNYVQPINVGGQNAVLWQYWLTNPGCDNSGCGDWNISSQLARSFLPAN